MAFAVFEVPGKDLPKANEVLADDQVSRLSIVTKEGKPYGLAEGSHLIFVEGDEDKVKRAAQLFSPFANKAKNEASIRDKIKAEEEEAAGGVGFIFG